ncbi:hypothetical protein chiPu_0012418 [Chiloscyllium punctatum]|uniref:Uncharacterized protein n=1 Tax=Chiloscyllium punctatum TaxID=137246 RepID=A0A401SU57_CHIPU|nr:hypothetical protein [Chiloscyllium punctatum]
MPGVVVSVARPRRQAKPTSPSSVATAAVLAQPETRTAPNPKLTTSSATQFPKKEQKPPERPGKASQMKMAAQGAARDFRVHPASLVPVSGKFKNWTVTGTMVFNPETKEK